VGNWPRRSSRFTRERSQENLNSVDSYYEPSEALEAAGLSE
jgi:hypothetical protein